ncbi:MAG TPA: transcriptional regulator [Dehalococcoidia bacterium]|nr:transcriptional regulator [Dehalococcoidia bacterium]
MSSLDENRVRKPTKLINRIIHEPARYLIVAYLYVVESADALYLQRQTGLTWGNLSSHLSKLESVGYVQIIKEFLDKKPHTMLQLTKDGRKAFEEYRENMKQVLNKLPQV